MMRIFKIIALSALVAGTFGMAQTSASASPLTAGAQPALGLESGLVSKAQYRDRDDWRWHRRHFNRPPAWGYHRYARPRVVCRVQSRWVRTPYGHMVRRPVEVCRRRW
jgi:hypothetical protein